MCIWNYLDFGRYPVMYTVLPLDWSKCSEERGGDGQKLDGVESCPAPGQHVRWNVLNLQWIFQLKEEICQGTEKCKNCIEILCLTLASAAALKYSAIFQKVCYFIPLAFQHAVLKHTERILRWVPSAGGKTKQSRPTVTILLPPPQTHSFQRSEQ